MTLEEYISKREKRERSLKTFRENIRKDSIQNTVRFFKSNRAIKRIISD